MSLPLEDIPSTVNIGEPTGAHGLRLFPLFPTRPPTLRVLPVAGALELGLAEVSEVPPERAEADQPWFRGLWVSNQGSVPVLLRDGDVLVGGRQDRVVDRPAVVPARTAAPIAVSCVEQARSDYGDDTGLRVAEASADPALRRARLAPGVTARPDQARTWSQVAERRRSAGLQGPGGSLAEVCTPALAEALLAAFPVPYGATGVVVSRADRRVALVEWCCDPDALRIAWGPLIRSLASLARPDARRPRISRTEVRRYLDHLAQAPARTRADEGLGEVVAIGVGSTAAIAVCWQGRAVHLAAVA